MCIVPIHTYSEAERERLGQTGPGADRQSGQPTGLLRGRETEEVERPRETGPTAQIQGGVGTAGSANIGTKYAMFEAIHGSAPRMVTEGRAQYADPCSMIKAVAMMMDHIGEAEKAKKLNMALDVCCQFEKKLVMTGRDTGATGDEFAEYIMETIQRPDLEQVWQGYIDAAIAANKN